MNKTHTGKNTEKEMLVKIKIQRGDVKGSRILCEKFGISSKRYAQLIKQVESIG